MTTAIFIGVLIISYLIGSLPMGLFIVKLISGKDIRNIQSGRTGGTNAMRAAGFWAGFATAALDIVKGASGIWIAQAFLPNNHWLEILAPVATILGHNYSIFLIDRNSQGRICLRGGAGGAPSVGGAMGLWAPSLLILVPAGALILFGLGYASVATMSLPIIAMIIFIVRASLGLSPWIYVLYGLLAELLLLWALRPNIKRLIAGNERLVGWRAKHNDRAKSHSKTVTNNT
jgi:glycerol-3-phosphate acyltransferase PlsY